MSVLYNYYSTIDDQFVYAGGTHYSRFGFDGVVQPDLMERVSDSTNLFMT